MRTLIANVCVDTTVITRSIVYCNLLKISKMSFRYRTKNKLNISVLSFSGLQVSLKGTFNIYIITILAYFHWIVKWPAPIEHICEEQHSHTWQRLNYFAISVIISEIFTIWFIFRNSFYTYICFWCIVPNWQAHWHGENWRLQIFGTLPCIHREKW